jgi:hypothetical protein
MVQYMKSIYCWFNFFHPNASKKNMVVVNPPLALAALYELVKAINTARDNGARDLQLPRKDQL